ncbi:unnamed protein product [Protopolystoma xenopodis]|uniref:Uncharacterized protein n=1 Tax=Protopolystoma xenopodis TaxID=117903 RepID=A0A448X8V1_9PLAT|nr:unnamed protein product [Protopolystoma xenopodis]
MTAVAAAAAAAVTSALEQDVIRVHGQPGASSQLVETCADRMSLHTPTRRHNFFQPVHQSLATRAEKLSFGQEASEHSMEQSSLLSSQTTNRRHGVPDLMSLDTQRDNSIFGSFRWAFFVFIWFFIFISIYLNVYICMKGMANLM